MELLIKSIVLFLVFFSITSIPVEAQAAEKEIKLISNENKSLSIAKINFKSSANETSYKISWQEDVFNDEFLSMRPFKCIDHEKQMICHLIYPYKKRGHITSDDLMDLEYDLLFLHKSPTEYGINAWNGLYYKLNQTNQGFIGQLMEIDLNILAAPPEDDILRPITIDMLHEADPAAHIYPRLIIE